MEPKTHTTDKIRIAYSVSPVSVKNKIKVGDKIYTDDNWLKEIEDILKDCDINYDLITTDVANKNIHEITIKWRYPFNRYLYLLSSYDKLSSVTLTNGDI